MAEVKIYSSPRCAFCRLAEALLERKGVPYERVDVSRDPETRSWLVAATGGRTTVPQIFIDGESIGGFDELSALDRSGELDRRLG